METVRTCFGLIVDDVPTLRSAQLRLTGVRGPGLAFADRWQPAPRRVGRVLCSEVLASAWSTRGLLAPPWGVPVQLGRLEVRVVHSGASPESSLLRIDDGGRVLVSALAARAPALPGMAAAEVAGADVLLLDGGGVAPPTPPGRAGATTAAPPPEAPNAQGALFGPDATAWRDALSRRPERERALWRALADLVDRGGGAVRFDDARLAPAVVAWLAEGPDVTRLYGSAAVRAALARVGVDHVSRWRGPLPQGAVGLWLNERAEAQPPAERTLDLQAPNLTPDGGAGWGLRPDALGLRALARSSGAADVVLWRATVDLARWLERELAAAGPPRARVWRLEADPQLRLV